MFWLAKMKRDKTTYRLRIRQTRSVHIMYECYFNKQHKKQTKSVNLLAYNYYCQLMVHLNMNTVEIR